MRIPHLYQNIFFYMVCILPLVFNYYLSVMELQVHLLLVVLAQVGIHCLKKRL
jgi:hypothetical protein